MSAEQSARSVSHAEGVDKVRALQRVLYRSAKQDPTRRFHALFDKVARSDILWRAWSRRGGKPRCPRHRRCDHRRSRTRGLRGAGVPRRPGRRADGEVLSSKGLTAGPHPQAGQAGRNPAARHPNGGRPGSHGGGQDRPRTHLRGRLPPMSFGFRPKRSAHRHSK